MCSSVIGSEQISQIGRSLEAFDSSGSGDGEETAVEVGEDGVFELKPTSER